MGVRANHMSRPTPRTSTSSPGARGSASSAEVVSIKVRYALFTVSLICVQIAKVEAAYAVMFSELSHNVNKYLIRLVWL